jgi:hypothetical protein
VEASNKTFDPDELETGDVQPKVTIDQAIKIAQIGAAQARAGRGADPFQEEEHVSEEEANELRDQLVRKLQRLADRHTAELAAQGWIWDEANQVMVPPGWVKTSDQGEPSRE